METEIKFRHLGIYGRRNPDGADVTVAEATLDARVLRTLFRKGTMGEGKLAAWCSSGLSDEAWQRCVARLVQWQMVEVVPNYWGETRKIALTADGKVHAEDLCHREQTGRLEAEEKALRDRLDKEHGV